MTQLGNIMYINEEAYVVKSSGSVRSVLVEADGSSFAIDNDLLEAANVTVSVKSVSDAGLKLLVNGKDIPIRLRILTPKSSRRSLTIAKFSVGKALAWVNKKC